MSSSLAKLTAWVLIVAAIGIVADARARPKALVTVDVESFDDIPLPKQVDTPCSDGSDCGVMRIATMLEERGFAGTFFLNVYEYKAWGEPAMRGLALALQARGHDVTLHTHPQWGYDAARPYMYQYDLEEQTRIVADGKELLERWTGRPVVAHRAGAYAANKSTLTALARNGIFVDSSLFLDHDVAHLNELGLPGNIPSIVDGVVEIPVTVYERGEQSAILGGLLPPFVSVRKIDVDWFRDDREARDATDAVIDADVPYLVMFLHSFSLMTGLTADGTPIADAESIARYGLMLDRIKSRGLDVVTIDELAAQHVAPSASDKNVVPRVRVDAPTHKYLWHLLRERASIREIAAACGAVGFAAVGLATLAFLRRRTARRALRASVNTQRGRAH